MPASKEMLKEFLYGRKVTPDRNVYAQRENCIGDGKYMSKYEKVILKLFKSILTYDNILWSREVEANFMIISQSLGGQQDMCLHGSCVMCEVVWCDLIN